MKQPKYMSFDAYMKQRRLYYNAALFWQDIMYFSKIWKAHRAGYLHYCEQHHTFHDIFMLDDRVNDYERRLAEHRFQAGIISEEAYEEQLSAIACRHGHGS